MRRGLEGCRMAVEVDAVQAGGFLEMFDYFILFYFVLVQAWFVPRLYHQPYAKFSRKLR